MNTLYKHQLDIIRDDPKASGIFHGTGSGKSLTALSLSRGRVLVIAPKTQVLDGNWQREVIKNLMKVDLTVISKETFRRDWKRLPRFDTVIVDEVHTMCGVTPNIRYRRKVAIPKASQLFEALEEFLTTTKPDRLYLCTATPIRSPMTVWALAKLLGHKLDFYAFRHAFYVRLPMPGREVFTAKSDSNSKDILAALVKKLGYTGRLEDFFDVPEQTYRTVYIDLKKVQKDRIKDMALEYPEPIVRVGKIHQIENGVLSGDQFNKPQYFDNAKIEKILDLALEFPRMVIFCKYRAQIEQIQKVLTENKYITWTLTGDTKDRGGVIRQANESPDGIFICQSDISAGWELPNFPTMIFCSLSWSFVSYEQAKGRILRANHLKKNLYIHLIIKNGVDEKVYKSILNKQDFHLAQYTNKR